MYGWRGRIGIVLPADNNVSEPDFHRMEPEGVTTHVARLMSGGIETYPKQALLYAARSFPITRVNLVGHMCAASSLILGPEGNRTFCDKLSDASGGLPSFTATTAMTNAINALGVRRLAIISAHRAEMIERLSGYLSTCGIATSAVAGLGLDNVEQRDAFNQAAPARLYRIARDMDLLGSDALFIAATNMRSLDVIETLEADLGLPVITSNQAAMWEALRLLGIETRIPGFGRLLNS